MDIIKTLQYMKPDIKVMVWENDIDRIKYNELETFRPTKQEIMDVDQNLVKQYWEEREVNNLNLEEINSKINELMNLLTETGNK